MKQYSFGRTALLLFLPSKKAHMMAAPHLSGLKPGFRHARAGKSELTSGFHSHLSHRCAIQHRPPRSSFKNSLASLMASFLRQYKLHHKKSTGLLVGQVCVRERSFFIQLNADDDGIHMLEVTRRHMSAHRKRFAGVRSAFLRHCACG